MQYTNSISNNICDALQLLAEHFKLIGIDPTLTSTHGGHPLSCAAASGNLDELVKKKLINRSNTLGKKLEKWLNEWKKEFPERIPLILGKGLVWSVFISKPNIAKKWFSDLFGWLDNCEKVFGFKNLKGYETKRLYAYLAERYLSFWFTKYTNSINWPLIFVDTEKI